MRTRQPRTSRTKAAEGPKRAATAPGAEAGPPPIRVVAGRARVAWLEGGLYALSIVGQAPPANAELPLTRVSAGPSTDLKTPEIALGPGPSPGWLGPSGGTAVARLPAGGGIIVVTTYGLGDAAPLPELTVSRLDRPSGERSAASPPSTAPGPSGRELQIEIALHIERQGDRRGLARGWAGNLGQRRRIEAFGLRPLEGIAAGDIEYMGCGPEGRQTPWVSDARLCGTRGRGMPLTGFAIRLVPTARERYDVIYEGSFFDSGTSGPRRDGEPCLPSRVDDPLEAIKLLVIERAR